MDTSPPLTVADLARFRATARAREAERRAEMDARRERSMTVARIAADLLRGCFGAESVVLFGSLARGGEVSWRTHVDLAARGVPVERYFAAVGRLQAIDPTVAVDLVRIEDAPAPLLAAIEAEGMPL